MRALSCVGFVSVSLLSLGNAQAATMIDFEDWAGGSGGYTSLVSGGYRFEGGESTPQGLLFIWPNPESGNPTQALHTNPKAYFSMSKLGGGEFSVRSIDLQEGLSWSDSAYVSLTGIGSSGGVVGKEIFYLDGDPRTYETFAVHLEQVSSIWFLAGGGHELMSVDNIVIPEPPATLMLVIGLVAMALRR